MSEPIDPQEVMLAELREFGTALAASIVVTPVADYGTHAGHEDSLSHKSPSGSTKPGAIYTCPMHPQIREPQPGNCPICGMTLELV